MLKIAAIAFTSAALGAASTFFLLPATDLSTQIQLSSNNTAPPFDDGDLEQRVASLEEQLLNEIERVAELEQQLGSGGAGFPRSFPVAEEGEAEADEAEETPQQRRQRISEERQRRNSYEGRVARLERGGFSADTARQIVLREEQLQAQQIEERWQRRRDNLLADQEKGVDYTRNPLREELGDDQYERYLEASGRSTSVGITRVMESSAASLSGVRAGDRILRYNGERVFNLSDLNNETIRGELGEVVTLDIERNGTEIQLTIPRGPLGITSRRRGR